MNWLKKILGDPNKKTLRSIQVLVDKINSLEDDLLNLSDTELYGKTDEFKHRISNGEKLDELLPEAFAVVRETSRRVLKMRHFDVQLIGGIVLHQGNIAEMRTGEGKTLAATSPLYLNALTGKGAHCVTVNDYLAKRDAAWMGQIYATLGLTVGCIQHESGYKLNPETMELEECSRQEAYACDITYGTNNEFGFDYLRDNMAPSLKDRVQRDLNYSIVDEVDSILIDEARTPLIISAPAEESNDLYYKFAQLARTLKKDEDYNIDEKMRASTLTPEGIEKIEKALGVENLYAGGDISTVHHIEQALKAEALFKLDRDYVVRDGEVIIVDEFTGRMMPGRRYSEGLHQAIEAKENVKIQRESQTLATITFQNYFRLYDKLAGMTGTAETESEEFYKIYGLEVVVIPTNKITQRIDESDRIYKSERGKFQAVVEEVKARQQKGQPVLIGTISIEKNEELSAMLLAAGVRHEVLNAKNHEREADIIKDAGRIGSVTLATNMAGRGVDIILGGHKPEDEGAIEAWQSEHNKVLELGGLHVMGTERHESRRIDNQLRGRAGRQGDPGSTQFYVSLDDDLMRIFSSDRVRNMMERMGVPENMPIENRVVSRSLESAQRRIEGHNFDIRKHIVEYDDVMNRHRETVYRLRRRILENFEQSISDKTDLLKEEVVNMIEAEIDSVVAFHMAKEQDEWNTKEIVEVLQTIYPVSKEVQNFILALKPINDDQAGSAEQRTVVIEKIMEDIEKQYDELATKISGQTEAGNSFVSLERSVLLRAIDRLWVEHLETMGYLRQSIGLRGYGQRDPLVEYKKEAYRLFNELLDLIRKQVVYAIFKVSIAAEAAPSLMAGRNLTLQGAAKTMQKGYSIGEESAGSSITSKANEEKVGRNDPCPCGSGKKYKKCHGA